MRSRKLSCYNITFIFFGRIFFLVFYNLHRNIISYSFFSDYDTTRMNSGLSGQTFKLNRHLKQLLFFLRSVFVNIFKFRTFRQFHFIKQSFAGIRNHFSDLINSLKRNLKNTPNITNNKLCFHFSESNNITYFLTTVFIYYIIKNFTATFFTKIHIKIGHTDTVRI